MKTHQNLFKPLLSPHQSTVVTTLVSIFTTQPIFTPQTQHQLSQISPKLTPDIVETVLKTFKSWKIALNFFNWAQSQSGYTHNSYSFNTMASILSGARQNAQLKILSETLLKSRCTMTPGALGFLIRCLGGRGMIEEAEWVFDQVKSTGLCVPDGYSYNCLLEGLSKYGSVESVEKRLSEMQNLGLRPDKYTLTPVLRCYCNARKFEKIMEISDKMKKEGWLDAHVLAPLAVAFCKWGEVDKAMDLIEKIEGYNICLSGKTHYVLIHGFVRENRIDKALVLYDKIRKMECMPDISVYDVLIEGLCKNKEVEKALSLYYEMKSLGISPDFELLRKLIFYSPCEKNMIELLEECGNDLGTESVTLLFNSVLKTFVNCGSVDKACQLLKGLIGDEFRDEVKTSPLSNIAKKILPNTNSFEIVIDGLCKGDELDGALDLFHEMDKIKCSRSLLLYNNLIDSLSSSDRADECNKLFTDMKERGIRPIRFTYNSIFGCFCKRGDVIEALKVAKEMRVNGYEPWIKYSTMLVKKLCENGKTSEASNFLCSLVEEGFLISIVPYSAAICGLIKIHKMDDALRLFRDIGSRGYCADVVAYNIIINGLCKAKRVSEANIIFNEMLEKGLIPTVVTYNSLIDGWCKIGDVDMAMLCFTNIIKKKSMEPNVVTCTTLIDGLCNFGRANDAINIWNEMREKGCAPNRISFMALIHGLCKCKMENDAIVFLREMEEMGLKPDTYIYAVLINSFLNSSNKKLAFDVLKRMINKQMFPDSNDKNYSALRYAVLKLSEDDEIYSNINILVAEGSIPNISSISDLEK